MTAIAYSKGSNSVHFFPFSPLSSVPFFFSFVFFPISASDICPIQNRTNIRSRNWEEKKRKRKGIEERKKEEKKEKNGQSLLRHMMIVAMG